MLDGQYDTFLRVVDLGREEPFEVAREAVLGAINEITRRLGEDPDTWTIASHTFLVIDGALHLHLIARKVS